jgi:hypothetical protein
MIQLLKNELKLTYSVYLKRTNSFGYLKPESNHPSHILE